MIIKNGKLVTLNKGNEFIENGAVFIKDGIIEDYGSTEDIISRYRDEEIIDAENNIIMPGIVCAHYHAYSAFARGMILEGKSPEDFIEILQKLWWRLDKALDNEDLYYSAAACAIELIKSGTTTIIDHNASPFSIAGSLDALSKGFSDIGIRGNYCYEVSERDGLDIAEEGLKENYEFIKNCRENNNSMITGSFGLHAAFTLGDEILLKAKKMSEELKCGFHIHVSEGMADEEINQYKYGMSPVKRLEKLGILGDKTIAVHGVNISAEEINILKATDTMVVHNPESNMNNAVGIPPIVHMLDKGIVVGLGTDGFTSDMFREMDTTYIIHKLINKKPYVMNPGEVWKMAFTNNSEIINRLFGRKAGVIEKGAFGDLILINYNNPTPLNSDNFFGHIIFGMNTSNVMTTIVNGKVIMKDRKLIGIDEEEFMKNARIRAEKLWERI
jgi:putative selenium metabolism protein SsnA